MKRKLKILFGSIVGLLIGGWMLAFIASFWASRRHYNLATVSEARAFAHIDGEIVDELGDTNGPYRLKGGVIGGVGKPFSFDLTCNGYTTNWSRPVSNHMWFVVTIFENHRGNPFAVVRKRTE